MSRLVADDYFPASDDAATWSGPTGAANSQPTHSLVEMLYATLQVLVLSCIDTAIFATATVVDKIALLVGAEGVHFTETLSNISVVAAKGLTRQCVVMIANATNATADGDAAVPDADEVVCANDTATVIEGLIQSPSRALVAALNLGGAFSGEASSSESLAGTLAITLTALLLALVAVWLRYRKYFDAFTQLATQHQLHISAAAKRTQKVASSQQQQQQQLGAGVSRDLLSSPVPDTSASRQSSTTFGAAAGDGEMIHALARQPTPPPRVLAAVLTSPSRLAESGTTTPTPLSGSAALLT